MNYKRRKPKRRKNSRSGYRYEGLRYRRNIIKKEFEEDRYSLIKFGIHAGE